jgi:hypothetical protein
MSVILSWFFSTNKNTSDGFDVYLIGKKFSLQNNHTGPSQTGLFLSEMNTICGFP